MKSIIVALVLLSSSFAAEFQVKMLNKGSNGDKMVFEPAIVKVQVGDTVTFIPTSKGHSVQSLKKSETRPAHAIKIKGKRNKPFTYLVKNEGIHMYKCKPHYAMGMIGMIVAGNPVNLNTIKKLKLRGQKSKKRFTKMIATLN